MICPGKLPDKQTRAQKLITTCQRTISSQENHLSRQTFGLPFTLSGTQMSKWASRKIIKNYYFEFTPLQVISRRQASFSLYVFTCLASTFKLLHRVIFNTCFLTGQKRDVTKQKFLWLVNKTLEWPETVPQSYRQIFRKLIITIKQWKL